MQYRKFGKLDWKASALGFGCMRLPFIDRVTNINEQEATRMLHYAIDHGVNYVDTAYAYHGGNSELFVGRVLKNGYREKVKLATKLPSWLIKTFDDFDSYLNEQLKKLQTDYIDLYLLHALNKERWPKIRDLGVLEWAGGAIADGRVKYLGFSFHDKYEVFQEIIDEYDKWTFCQIQYNYMDIENQAGLKGLRYATSKGLAVVIMEPLLGGKLVKPPQPIQELWDTAPNKRTPAEWGLQWLWNQPEVSVVLSGMSAMQHVEENIASANVSGIEALSDEELTIIDKVREKYQELCPIPCTRCNYCMPCSNDVDIPENLWTYNEGLMYDKAERSRGWYRWLEQGYKMSIYPTDKRAINCIQCRECEPKCPQSIPISEWMPIIHQVLGEGKAYDECPSPE